MNRGCIDASATGTRFCPGVTGSVCLVTGGAQGIGEAVVRLLARHGARVAILDTAYERAQVLAEELRRTGALLLAAQVDVRDGTKVEDLVERVELELGSIDVLVNAAGVLKTGPAQTFAEAEFRDLLDVNTTGVFLVSRAVARRMIPRRTGRIVTISSNTCAVVRSGMAAYAASKAAATAFTKCLGLELAPFGIRCNVVSPGSTDTPMQRSLWSDSNGGAAVIAGSPPQFRVGIPLGKLASADEVAEAVLFLACDRSSHITMQDLCIDGGASLRA
jgi:2,3-dihydro-2,3-dihydroxybenzoate dehydrogenase